MKIPADHLTPESRANNINTTGLAITTQNIAKSLLPGSVFHLFLWHKPSARTRRADWHRPSLHTSFHIEFLHQFLKCPSGPSSSSIMDTTKQLLGPQGGVRRGITILHVSNTVDREEGCTSSCRELLQGTCSAMKPL